MRAVLVLVAAVMFGLAGGYAWSAMARHPAHVHVPKVPKAARIVIPETPADSQWTARADEKETSAAPSSTDSPEPRSP
jgi:hypothetical protein